MDLVLDVLFIVGMTILLFWGDSLVSASFEADEKNVMVWQRIVAFVMFAGFVSLIYFWS